MSNSSGKSARLTYADVQIGNTYSFETILNDEDIRHFAEITGDHNPLHTDPKYGEKTLFKKNIAHGMLVGSLFSRLIGMHCPGENSLYLSQTLEFKKPVFAGEILTVRGIVTQKVDSAQLIVLKTEIMSQGEMRVQGEARAKFLTGENL